MTDITRRTALKTLGALGVVGIAGTGTAAARHHAAPAPTGDTARVRIAHASPNAPPVDVYVNGSRAVADLAFTEFAPDFTTGPAYLELPADDYDVTITAAGDPSTVAFEGTVPFEGDLTVAAIGELFVEESDHGASGPDRAFRPLLIPDELEFLPSGLTRFRAVHASPDAPAVQVSVGVRTIAEDLAFGEASDVATLTPGTKTVTIAAADDPDVVVFEGDVTLGKGTVYTAFAEGYLTTEDEPVDESFRPVVAAAPADDFQDDIRERQEAIRRDAERRRDDEAGHGRTKDDEECDEEDEETHD